MMPDGGKTVGGTADPEPGSTETTAWPSALDRANYTAARQSVIEKLAGRPVASVENVADAAGVSNATVRTTLRQALDEVESADELPFDAEAVDPLEANREQIEQMIRDGHDSHEIGERFGLDAATVGNVRGGLDPSPRAVNEDAESVMSEGSDLERIDPANSNLNLDPTQGRETPGERPGHSRDPCTGYDAGTVAALLLALLVVRYVARRLAGVVR
jgi:DNA-binding CsgD family transcriptional regulator